MNRIENVGQLGTRIGYTGLKRTQVVWSAELIRERELASLRVSLLISLGTLSIAFVDSPTVQTDQYANQSSVN